MFLEEANFSQSLFQELSHLLKELKASFFMQALMPRWVLNPFVLTCIFVSSERRGEAAWKAGMTLQTSAQKGRNTLRPYSCTLGPSTTIQHKAKFIAGKHGFWQGSFKHKAW